MPGPSRLGTFPPPRGVTFHPGIDGSPALEQESPSLPACPANPAPRLGMCAATDSSNSSVVSSRHCRSPPWQTGAPSYPPAGTLAHDQGRIRRQNIRLLPLPGRATGSEWIAVLSGGGFASTVPKQKRRRGRRRRSQQKAKTEEDWRAERGWGQRAREAADRGDGYSRIAAAQGSWLPAAPILELGGLSWRHIRASPAIVRHPKGDACRLASLCAHLRSVMERSNTPRRHGLETASEDDFSAI
ncbi:unnamed protein product [Diplocarpon coronariae]